MIVYVSGCTHGGTTLLYRLLNAHPDIISIGSAKNLPEKIRHEHKACQCGNPVKSCEFWTRVDSKLRKGYDSRSLSTLNIEDFDIRNFRKENRIFFGAIKEVSGCNIVVDSSRNSERLKKLNSSFDENSIKVINIYKKPPAQVLSWIRKKKQGVGRASLTYSVRWLRTIWVTKRRESTFTLSYEDFCDDPHNGLRSLFTFLGVSASRNMIDDILKKDLAELKCHALGGQRLRFSPNKIKKDERWKDDLTINEKIIIWIICVFPYLILRTKSADSSCKCW